MAKIYEPRDRSSFFMAQFDAPALVIKDRNGANNQMRLNYHRYLTLPSWRNYVTAVKNALEWDTGTRIAIIGAGMAMFHEWLVVDHGFTSVVSCEDSAWVQSSKNDSEEPDICASIASWNADPFTGSNPGGGLYARDVLTDGGPRSRCPILDENLLDAASRNNVKNALGGQVDVVFTDDLLDYIPDANALGFSQAARASGIGPTPQIVHAIGTGTGNSLRFNAKGAEAWKAFLPNDTFVDWANGYAVS